MVWLQSNISVPSKPLSSEQNHTGIVDHERWGTWDCSEEEPQMML